MNIQVTGWLYRKTLVSVDISRPFVSLSLFGGPKSIFFSLFWNNKPSSKYIYTLNGVPIWVFFNTESLNERTPHFKALKGKIKVICCIMHCCLGSITHRSRFGAATLDYLTDQNTKYDLTKSGGKIKFDRFSLFIRSLLSSHSKTEELLNLGDSLKWFALQINSIMGSARR